MRAVTLSAVVALLLGQGEEVGELLPLTGRVASFQGRQLYSAVLSCMVAMCRAGALWVSGSEGGASKLQQRLRGNYGFVTAASFNPQGGGPD